MDLPNNKMALVSCMFKQIKGEEDAMEGYAAFLAKYGDRLNDKDKATVMEVIADELNHSLKLTAMAKKYSGVTPSQDDLAEALSYLAKK